MSVSTFQQPDSTTQSASTYPGIVDSAISVLTRIGDNFAPHEQAVPDMTVAVDPGHLMNGQTLVEQTSQSTSAITAPSTNPRIDRIVIDNTTGGISVVTGTESASPTPPAIPVGTSPVAQILLQVSSTAITNAMLTDERDFSNIATSTGGLVGIQTFTGSGTYSSSSGTTKIIVEVIGGGGSGGGCGSTTSTQGAAAGGGSAGSFARSMLTSGFSGIAVTVGAGGAATAAGANNGNNGSASSFGSIVSAPGGSGGPAGGAGVPNIVTGGGVSGGSPTGGSLISSVGEPGGYGVVVSITSVVGGTGGSSIYGGGGRGGGNAGGTNALSAGAGGGGASAIRSSAAHAGGAGADGMITVYEYG